MPIREPQPPMDQPPKLLPTEEKRRADVDGRHDLVRFSGYYGYTTRQHWPTWYVLWYV